MEAALGGFGWSPETFWAATFSEFHAAHDYHSGAAAKRARRQDYAAWKRMVEMK